MNIGTAYAEAYQQTYNAFHDANAEARNEEVERLKDLKLWEPVGTDKWHALVGSLTALGVLSGRYL